MQIQRRILSVTPRSHSWFQDLAGPDRDDGSPILTCFDMGFINYLVTYNVPHKFAQTLARHSTITLTMNRYAHLGVFDLVDALKRLPEISADSKSDHGIKAAGKTHQTM